MKSFRALLVVSLAVAAIALAAPLLSGSVGFMTSLKASIFLALLWTIVVLFALIRYRKRGFWLLLGAPVALYWSFVFAWIAWNCAHDLKPFCG
jgi:hypothetical protein